jgi:RNA polymerase sigma-B factor
LAGTLRRSPTVADIAEYLQITEEQVLEGLEAARVYAAAILSTPVGGDRTTELGETLDAEDHDLELAELRVALGAAFGVLDARDRKILALRFHGNLTQTEIGERVGLSQMQISRLIIRALDKLRVQLLAA